MTQALQTREFIQSKNIPSSEPVILMGDMNVDRYTQVKNYSFFSTFFFTIDACQTRYLSLKSVCEQEDRSDIVILVQIICTL